MPKLKFNYNLRSLSDDYTNAHIGLADLHEYMDLDPNEIAKGEMKNFIRNDIYKSNSGLSPEELYQIAQEAKKLTYMDGQVKWINAALMEAKNKTKDAKFINKLK